MSRLLVIQDGTDQPPDSCFEADDAGTLPTCSNVNGTWQPSYDDGTSGDGFAGLFALVFVLAVIVGIAAIVWRVSTAQRMARESGMNERDATAMALLTDNGLEATYLASSVRTPSGVPANAPASAAERLQQLRDLVDQDLITRDEYEARRRAIIDSV